jgi:hypothetical protein
MDTRDDVGAICALMVLCNGLLAGILAADYRAIGSIAKR